MKKLFRRLFLNKEQREFDKMHRKHRKELVEHAKKTNEWDWSWLHESVIMQIKHMHEYYSKGYNVWQVDESRLKIVEQLKHVLDLQTEIEKTQEDGCGVKYVYENDELVKTIYPDDYSERVLNNYKKEQELYEELYRYIGKYLRWWWD